MRDAHIVARLKATMELQRERQEMSLGRRLDRVLRDLTLQGGLPASRPDRDVIRTGTSSSMPPPDAHSGYDEHYRRALAVVQVAEREVDDVRVRSISADFAGETPDDRDKRLIRDFEGFCPNDVVAFDRSFGTTRAVERARVRMNRDPYLGGRKLDGSED